MADDKVVEGIRKALEGARPRKFRESVEICINLKDVDLAIPKNRIDEEVVLPKGRGKQIRVCVFASGELAMKVRPVADLVILSQNIFKIPAEKIVEARVKTTILGGKIIYQR